MESGTYMVYKGEQSTAKTESAVISFSADKVTEVDGGFVIANKDGSVGLEIIPRNGAKLRKLA
jgi:hypothetical protein